MGEYSRLDADTCVLHGNLGFPAFRVHGQSDGHAPARPCELGGVVQEVRHDLDQPEQIRDAEQEWADAVGLRLAAAPEWVMLVKPTGDRFGIGPRPGRQAAEQEQGEQRPVQRLAEHVRVPLPEHRIERGEHCGDERQARAANSPRDEGEEHEGGGEQANQASFIVNRWFFICRCRTWKRRGSECRRPWLRP